MLKPGLRGVVAEFDRQIEALLFRLVGGRPTLVPQGCLGVTGCLSRRELAVDDRPENNGFQPETMAFQPVINGS